MAGGGVEGMVQGFDGELGEGGAGECGHDVDV